MNMRNPLSWSLIVAAAAASLALAASAGAVTPSAVYDATPSPLPPNVASLGFEATSTSEFGDQVHLGGTNRVLDAVTVTMSDWALYSDYSTDVRYAGNSATWSHPITVNVYSTHLGANGAPDTLLATKTQNVTIPWRPAADPTCPGGTAWRAADNSLLQRHRLQRGVRSEQPERHAAERRHRRRRLQHRRLRLDTDPRRPGRTTRSTSAFPRTRPSTVGSDANADAVFWNTSYAPFYADGGAAGTGTSARTQTGRRTARSRSRSRPPRRWSLRRPARTSARTMVGRPSTTRPIENQGECVSYVTSHLAPSSSKRSAAGAKALAALALGGGRARPLAL